MKIALLAIASVFGCSDNAESELSHSQKKAADTTITVSKTTKPGASIKLISPPLIYINPNQQVRADIILETTVTNGELIVVMSPPDGLDLLDTALKQTINVVSAAPIKIPVTLVASTNGRYHLDIHAKLNNGDSISTRNLTLIVQVGESAHKTIQLKKTAGENVIPLPAQETISNP